MSLTNKEMAFVLLRITIALNILIHGLVRMGDNLQGFVDWTLGLLKDSVLPIFAVEAFAYSIPFLEILIGILLLVGLFTELTLIAGTLLMLALMTGMCVIQKWDIVGMQMVYIVLYFILLFLVRDYNRVALDSYRSPKDQELRAKFISKSE